MQLLVILIDNTLIKNDERIDIENNITEYLLTDELIFACFYVWANYMFASRYGRKNKIIFLREELLCWWEAFPWLIVVLFPSTI